MSEQEKELDEILEIEEQIEEESLEEINKQILAEADAIKAEQPEPQKKNFNYNYLETWTHKYKDLQNPKNPEEGHLKLCLIFEDLYSLTMFGPYSLKDISVFIKAANTDLETVALLEGLHNANANKANSSES